jgi:hypothetical protein
MIEKTFPKKFPPITQYKQPGIEEGMNPPLIFQHEEYSLIQED